MFSLGWNQDSDEEDVLSDKSQDYASSNDNYVMSDGETLFESDDDSDISGEIISDMGLLDKKISDTSLYIHDSSPNTCSPNNYFPNDNYQDTYKDTKSDKIYRYHQVSRESPHYEFQNSENEKETKSNLPRWRFRNFSSNMFQKFHYGSKSEHSHGSTSGYSHGSTSGSTSGYSHGLTPRYSHGSISGSTPGSTLGYSHGSTPGSNCIENKTNIEFNNIPYPNEIIYDNSVKFTFNKKLSSIKYENIIFSVIDYLNKFDENMNLFPVKYYFYKSDTPSNSYQLQAHNLRLGVKAKTLLTAKVLLLFQQMIFNHDLNILIKVLKKVGHVDLTISDVIKNINNHNKNSFVCYNDGDVVTKHYGQIGYTLRVDQATLWDIDIIKRKLISEFENELNNESTNESNNFTKNEEVTKTEIPMRYVGW
ncbi:hypothetical protein QJ850_gp615 [Acanthamoeba polyphaga mimivirus]|uniref:Uncharacterized protein n=1 Tax=Acanthamoeba polyphaga mimivirus Kroon TaxID=3069720 RepID=A0A0G2Y6B3_9VIRU|nr:hypothetical protein QJ850_gp615 [Acanthamoeba polyphaga mimivirus]AKI80084.1 hypothetical protein [Acanthamoeba polyphaga mimivirus Kroon]